MKTHNPYRILFVCLGNICRSPAAEVIFNAFLKAAGDRLPIEADSCATASYHTGSKPDARMLAALKRAGFTYGGHRARTFTTADFHRFDLIIPMDESIKEDLRQLARGEEEKERIIPMSRWFPATAASNEVPDPYYGGDSGFDYVVELLSASMPALLEDIAQRMPAPSAS